MIARADHPLVGQQGITLQRLAEERFLLREPGSGIRDVVLKCFAEEGLRPNVRIELGSNEAIKHAVVGGLGISTMSLHSLALDAESGRIALLDVAGFPIQRHWYLVYPKGRELSMVAKAFLTFAADHSPAIRARLDATMEALQKAHPRG
jgi:DNA-binding transcriptional LysR family regulator